jgi:hypothetical protein
MNRIITRGLGPRQQMVSRGYGRLRAIVQIVYLWLTALVVWLGRRTLSSDNYRSTALGVGVENRVAFSVESSTETPATEIGCISRSAFSSSVQTKTTVSAAAFFRTRATLSAA